MKINKRPVAASFINDYEDNLAMYLKAPASGRSYPTRTAKELGAEAVSKRLTSIDIVSLHIDVFNNLAFAVEGAELEKKKSRTRSQRANKFLIQALAPLEKSIRLEQTMNESNLRAAQGQLKQEAARNKALLDTAVKSQGQARTLAHQFILAQEEERKEISRELHDQVAQLLAGINVRLSELKISSKIDLENLESRITQTQDLVEQSVELVHNYARRLRPAMLDDLGLIPSLRSYINDLPGCKGLKIELIASPEVEILDNKSRTVLYRVAQESLKNIARHAHAKKAKVLVKKCLDRICLEITDDGKSFDTNRILSLNTGKRLGLIGMRERVEMVGGTFSIESMPGKGTTVKAEIPVVSMIGEKRL